MISRRKLIGASAVLAGAAAVTGRAQAAAIPEVVTTTSPAMQPPLIPTSGPSYQPVVTLNGWTLPWRMTGDWKEFHLVAEPVVREIAPGMKANYGDTTVSRPDRLSSVSRATRFVSLSPTNYPSTRRSIGTACSCRMAWMAWLE